MSLSLFVVSGVDVLGGRWGHLSAALTLNQRFSILDASEESPDSQKSAYTLLQQV